jgi:hypothetical protein
MTPLVLLAALATGQHCGSYGGYGQSYGYNYSYSPGYSYGYPGFNYGQSYSYVYAQPYIAPKVVVQKQVVTKFVEVVPKYNYAGLVADYDRQEKQQEAATAEVQSLKAEIAKLTTTITGLQQQAPAPQVQQVQPAPQAYYPQPQAAPQQPVYQQQAPPQKPAPQSYAPAYPQPQYQAAPPKVNPYAPALAPPPATPSTAVSGISLSRCVDCHTAPAARGGGFVIFDAPGVLSSLTPDDWQAMEDQVRAGLMPKRGPRFNEQELQAFLQEKAVATGAALVNR